MLSSKVIFLPKNTTSRLQPLHGYNQKRKLNIERNFLVKELLLDFIDFDMDAATPQSPFDAKSMAWWQESWQEAIQLTMGQKNAQEKQALMEIVSD